MEKVDFKKVYKDLYLPKTTPMVISVPNIKFIMIDGKGNPNTCEEYKNACEILYGLSYSIKMSKMKGSTPKDYYDYVVPPLEGLWWVNDENFDGLNNIINKDLFGWTSMIRQPEFVTQEVFEAAKKVLHKKKPELDLSVARLEDWEEGLCAQVMHIGTFDDEPETIKKLEDFIVQGGYKNNISNNRRHHEIYLGDPRKCAPEKLKTVIRHPITYKHKGL